ncbi:MAG: hypothetical protein ABFD21_07455 [Anaerolineaceae bacterium]
MFSQLAAVWLGLASGRVGEGTGQMNVVVGLLLDWLALALPGIAGIRLWGLLRKGEVPV